MCAYELQWKIQQSTTSWLDVHIKINYTHTHTFSSLIVLYWILLNSRCSCSEHFTDFCTFFFVSSFTRIRYVRSKIAPDHVMLPPPPPPLSHILWVFACTESKNKKHLSIAISAVAKHGNHVLLSIFLQTAINCSLCRSNASRVFHFHNQTIAKLSQRFHSSYWLFFRIFYSFKAVFFYRFCFRFLSHYSGIWVHIYSTLAQLHEGKIPLFNFDEMEREWNELPLSIKNIFHSLLFFSYDFLVHIIPLSLSRAFTHTRTHAHWLWVVPLASHHFLLLDYVLKPTHNDIIIIGELHKMRNSNDFFFFFAFRHARKYVTQNVVKDWQRQPQSTVDEMMMTTKALAMMTTTMTVKLWKRFGKVEESRKVFSLQRMKERSEKLPKDWLNGFERGIGVFVFFSVSRKIKCEVKLVNFWSGSVLPLEQISHFRSLH